MKSINFLPGSYRLKTARRHWVARKSALAVILVLCLVCWGFEQRRQTTNLQQRVTGLEAQSQVVRDQQSELNKLREESEFLHNQVVVQRELAQSVSHTQIIAMLGELLPPSVAMLELSMTTKRPPPREEEDDDEATSSRQRRVRRSGKSQSDEPPPNLIEISFSGLAPDDLTVANVVAGINESPLFVDVQWPYSRPVTHEGVMGRAFELKMTVPLDCDYCPATESKEVADAG